MSSGEIFLTLARTFTVPKTLSVTRCNTSNTALDDVGVVNFTTFAIITAI